MQNKIQGFLDMYMKEQTQRRKAAAVLLVLSILVAAAVFWMLKMNGIALAGNAFCGKEEHTHTEECYEKILTCGQEEAEGHVHTDACYEMQQVLGCETAEHIHGDNCYITEEVLICTLEESEGHIHGEACYDEEGNLICTLEECEGHTHSAEKGCYETRQVLACELPEHTHTAECYIEQKVLICGREEAEVHVHTDACYEEKLVCEKEEHTHTAICYSDKNADLESAADWERTIPKELTSVWEKDLILVARSQLGYIESARNFIWDEENERQRGYTRYGAWYGNEYGDWCAMFVSFCLNYAQIPREAVPYEAGCHAWTVRLKNNDIYEQPDGYIPVAGDIIFFDYRNAGSAEHVGIVADVEEKEDGRLVIHTIEGNSSNRVKENTYDLTDTHIFGYGNLAKAKARYDEMYGTGEPEEAASSTLNAVIYTDDTYAVEAEDAAIITVTGVLPEDAAVKAYPVTVEIENQEVIAAYDIAIFLADGTVYEPEEGEKLEVRFTLPEQEAEVMDNNSEETEAETAEEVAPTERPLSVYYVPDAEEGLPEQIQNTTVDNNEITFEAEHFSVYAVARAARADGLVTNAEELKNAFADVTEEAKMIQLAADFEVTDVNKIEINSGNYTLDLNGHKLTVKDGNPLFTVKGGSLTIMDSQKINETAPVTVTDKNLYGNPAAYTETDGLTYYVTESAVTNAATGATTETLKRHVVPLSGRISAGGAAVVNVTGGTVNLESGMLYEGTNRAFNLTGGTVNLKGGYIFGFKKTNANGGAILSNNAVINLSGTVLADNEATGGTIPNGAGGAIAAIGKTELNITGGIISGNTASGVGNWDGSGFCGGGGIICMDTVTVDMSGGYLTNNYAASDRYFDGGGGIFLTGTSDFTLNGGCITGNQAQGGGGIKTDFGKNTKVTMNGGFISSNATTDAEGGGVTIDRGGNGYFNAGYITNNKILNTVHWGGGGLFCADGSSLYLKKALITENDAGGFGGGVAGCPTGKIYLYIDDGCAIYNNADTVDKDKDGIHFVNGGAKDGIDAERCDAFFQSHGHKDYFCALNSTVTGTMLGNFPANWEGSADGTAVNLGGGDAQTAASVMGLEAHPTDEAIASAQENAAVYINGNYSYTHGGGILCNGNLIIGNPTDINIPARLALTATKAFLDASGNKQTGLDGYNFQFEIVDSADQVVSTPVCDADGNITFDNLVFEQEGTYVYTIREVKDDSKPGIHYDTAEYRLTVTVKKEETSLYEATKTAYLISNTKVEKSDGNGGWTVVSDKNYGSGKDNLALSLTGDKDTFVNTTESVSKITVIKKWADNVIGADSVTVDLYQDGEVFVERDDATVNLNAGNNWTYTWENLPLDHFYEVREREPKGYIASYETSNSQGKRTDYWVPASSLEVGKQYMIVNADGNKALYISPDHQNHGFDITDTKEVTQGTGTMTVGSAAYSVWYDAEGIDPRCIFTAQEKTQNADKGIILKNNGASVGTWLLIQNADNNHLKSTSGSNYASVMSFTDDVLKGQDGYNWNPNNLRTVIYSNNKFNTSANANAADAVKLYTLVSESVSGGSVITITNTPKEVDIEYELPETGGTGTHGYILWGLFLMAASLGIYGQWTFKKRRERSRV